MSEINPEGLFQQPVQTRTDDPDMEKVAEILGDVNKEQLKLYRRMAPWWHSGWAVCALVFLGTAIGLMWAMLFRWIDAGWGWSGLFLLLAFLFGVMRLGMVNMK